MTGEQGDALGGRRDDQRCADRLGQLDTHPTVAPRPGRPPLRELVGEQREQGVGAQRSRVRWSAVSSSAWRSRRATTNCSSGATPRSRLARPARSDRTSARGRRDRAHPEPTPEHLAGRADEQGVGLAGCEGRQRRPASRLSSNKFWSISGRQRAAGGRPQPEALLAGIVKPIGSWKSGMSSGTSGPTAARWPAGGRRPSRSRLWAEHQPGAVRRSASRAWRSSVIDQDPMPGPEQSPGDQVDRGQLSAGHR